MVDCSVPAHMENYFPQCSFAEVLFPTVLEYIKIHQVIIPKHCEIKTSSNLPCPLITLLQLNQSLMPQQWELHHWEVWARLELLRKITFVVHWKLFQKLNCISESDHIESDKWTWQETQNVWAVSNTTPLFTTPYLPHSDGWMHYLVH